MKTNVRLNLIQTCILVAALTTPAVAQAQFNFITNNGAIVITGYTGLGGAVNIPSTINVGGTNLPVVAIGDSAFRYSALTRLTIPDNVTNIGNEAFYYCTRLTNVTIGNDVISIGERAFYNTGLTNVTIPDSVKSIGNYAFAGCGSLTGITVDANNPAYSSMSGVLFDKSQATLIQYPPGETDGSYIIPAGVTSIGNEAFGGCAHLTNITIPDGVVNIGVQSFEFCTKLSDITIPDSVTNLGNYSFENCSGLTSVTIGNSVNSIAEGAFYYDYSLTSLAIPDSVTSVGNNSFKYCWGLTNVTIGSNVTSIGNEAFTYCYALTSITIPEHVTSIGVNAFVYSYNLGVIAVVTNNPVYSSVDGVLFDKDQTLLIRYPQGKGGGSYIIPASVSRIGDYAFDSASPTSITIPDSVTNLGNYSFENCSGLTNVTIGNSVNSIGDDAFVFCYNLASITIPGSVTNIGFEAFANCYSLTNVYFRGNAPAATWSTFIDAYYNNMMAYYLPGTTGWSGFSTDTGLPAVLWKPLIQTGDAGFGVRTNQFGFNINWASGQTVVVEACTNLANRIWSSVATNTFTGDSSYFSDPKWTNHPARFYRLRSP